VHDPPSIGGPSFCHVSCTIDTSSSVEIVVAMVATVGLLIFPLSLKEKHVFSTGLYD
jgi:hypothetical protein